MTIVTDHLERLGVRFEVLPHDRSETALEEAQALDIDPEEVLKPEFHSWWACVGDEFVSVEGAEGREGPESWLGWEGVACAHCRRGA